MDKRQQNAKHQAEWRRRIRGAGFVARTVWIHRDEVDDFNRIMSDFTNPPRKGDEDDRDSV